MSLKTVFSPLTITTLSLIGIVVVGTISFLSIEVIAPIIDSNKASSRSSSLQSSAITSSLSLSDSNAVQVNNSQVMINFSLNQATGRIDYTGTVNGPNGCSYVKNHDLIAQSDNLILQIQLGSKGDICTQVISELPISGGKVIPLSQNQKDNFKKLFTVKVLN